MENDGKPNENQCRTTLKKEIVQKMSENPWNMKENEGKPYGTLREMTETNGKTKQKDGKPANLLEQQGTSSPN